MRVVVRGHQLPGLTCGRYTNIHVGLQVGREPVDLVPADAAEAQWVAEIRQVDGDFRGPALHGKKGERFLYLTWGSVADGSFNMFRRAMLMLADLPADVQQVTVSVNLTDDHGMPRCARLRPAAVQIL